MNNIIVVKCGGSILAELTNEFFESIKELQNKGNKIVIVHGGGPEIEQMLTSLSIKSEFVNGLRKTTSEVLDTVEMILAGSVNKKLVSMLTSNKLKAIGLSGVDGELLKATPINADTLGHVGEVKEVNTELIKNLLNLDYIPVIAPIGAQESGQKLNINADTAAASIASALKAKHLLFVTDVSGILKNGNLLEEVSEKTVQELMLDGTIYGGMIPKVKAALSAMSDGLNEIMIVSGKTSFVTFEGSLAGTKLIKELEVV
ncbi:acetylglutamate kinase [Litchfieldia salsa]|uniref:Acetylglutamate kinase n=1 Tax=Litchfieldia salsa TaxID=930152 RepID=A0A1H0S7W0_9BACI|nr:acetylglutamate kinase [Litchfieldia salsa]SDP37735.1 N-acetylglutamate kinase [Litchfieldia salsa]